MKSIQQILMQMQAQNDQPQVEPVLLVELVDYLRPKDVENSQEIQNNIQNFIDAVIRMPTGVEIIQRYFLRLLNQYKQVSLYAESGILSLEGFSTQLTKRIGAHFLPHVKDDSQLKALVGRVFSKPTDHEWLENISHEEWQKLLQLFAHSNANQGSKHRIRMQMINAMMTISYRISAISLHPEFTHAYPQIDEYESPFFIQNRELIEFIETYKKYETKYDEVSVIPLPNPAQALVILDQCRDVMLKVKRATKRTGVSLSLTYLLVLLEQSIVRLESLLHLITAQGQSQHQEMIKLIKQLTHAHYGDQSVRELLAVNTELMALQVTENASKSGEHYVSTDRKGFAKMYKKAAWAGAIIATMATIKILLGRLFLAPILQAITNSLNYGLGFVFIHVLKLTVATKQPAMTAAALAATVQNSKGSRNAQMAELSGLIVNIIRTQFIAIVGNISIAMPTAFLIVYAWQWAFDEPLMNPAKATYVLHRLDPFASLAVPHAAVAGVCLFLSGLIAGYYDNLATYRHIGARIQAHERLQKLFNPKRLKKIANYVENNLGAIMGNFIFGFMLGSMSTIGHFLGLPLDIRHIAFASANLIQGLLTVNSPDLALVIISALGVLLIGLTNLFVSFSLTIIVALRARRVQMKDWKSLAKLILTHFVTHPWDFFWPPKRNEQPVIKG
ncbi:site-specific recombinase [Acinetobacter sp. c3-l95]|uniref:site-specific recombinase n=1 Tax=Acinetobacter sp. c3-l95 TaxID=3342804 RepID=UPI0035B75FF7